MQLKQKNHLQWLCSLLSGSILSFISFYLMAALIRNLDSTLSWWISGHLHLLIVILSCTKCLNSSQIYHQWMTMNSKLKLKVTSGIAEYKFSTHFGHWQGFELNGANNHFACVLRLTYDWVRPDVVLMRVPDLYRGCVIQRPTVTITYGHEGQVLGRLDWADLLLKSVSVDKES